jgi:NAD(P)-dependent dehydrogenase (short-subunit alcohol dehydrogenase family)
MGLMDGQVVLLTAGGGAIASATALRMAADGARVVLADVNREAAETTAERVRATGGEALALAVDALDADDCERMIAAVEDQYGALHVLCNLVGYFGPRGGGKLDEIDLERWHWMFDINLKSVFLVSRAAIPLMLRSGGGAIVNTGTLAALIGRPGGPAYGASKSGVLSLTRAMASEYQPYGIRVNCVCPSGTDTPMYFHRGKDDSAREAAASSVQGLSTPEEIAEVFHFLGSQRSTRVTGHILSADNGFSEFRQ